jgi:hypothetical protein
MSIPVIIIPALNRFDLLETTLDSIDHPVDNVLIIDNAGSGWQPKNDRLNIRVLNMPSNQGIAGSWNLGIKCYPHVPYWVFGSADTSFRPNELKKFEDFSGPDYFIKSNAHYSCFSLGENIVKTIDSVDDNGINVLYKNNGAERYPDFKLYKMIARCVHNHTPNAQLDRPEFSKFIINKNGITKGEFVMNIDELPSYVS